MKKVMLGLVLVLISGAVCAQPAPWWKWKSKLNGRIQCAQTSLGDGWERHSGPYKDARCEIAARSKSQKSKSR